MLLIPVGRVDANVSVWLCAGAHVFTCEDTIALCIYVYVYMTRACDMCVCVRSVYVCRMIRLCNCAPFLRFSRTAMNVDECVL